MSIFVSTIIFDKQSIYVFIILKYDAKCKHLLLNELLHRETKINSVIIDICVLNELFHWDTVNLIIEVIVIIWSKRNCSDMWCDMKCAQFGDQMK